MIKKINCMIVDDEPLARDLIRDHLSGFTGWIVVAECENASKAWELLQEKQVDVLFLDVQMPGIKGTSLVRSLKEPPHIVFTTAHQDYAIEGFELMAVDYLLKPITLSRFGQTIKRLEDLINGKDGEVNPVSDSNRNLSSDHIFVKQNHRLVKLLHEEIVFLEARRDATLIYLTGNRTITVNYHLKILEDALPERIFFRTHRSFIVSLGQITAINGNILEVHGFQVPIGGSYREGLMKSVVLIP